MEEEEEEIASNNEIFNIKKIPEKTLEKIKNVIRLEVGDDIATGFLCKINLSNKYLLPFLITCFHVIDDKYINNINEHPLLEFTYFSNNQVQKSIIILSIKRFIYQDEESDVTIIEIKEEDGLDIYSFLDMDYTININNPQIINKKVYLLHYPKGVKDLQLSKGEVKDLLDNCEFTTNYATEPGSSGAPIFDSENNCVIGIHRASLKSDVSHTGLCTILKYVANKFAIEKEEEIKSSYKRLYPFPDTMDMIYLIPNNKKGIKLFGDKFIKRHEYDNYLQLMYNGIIYNFAQYFPYYNITEEDKNKGEIKITLKGINYITNMRHLFSHCDELKKVIATGTDMSKVEIMEEMFEWCKNLEELSNTYSWNLANVTNTKCLFYKCVSLKKIPGLYHWDPLKLKFCNEMFLGCQKSLNISEVSQIYNWKNISENDKKVATKGFSVKFWIPYMLFDNFVGTCVYIKNIISFMKKNKK